MSRGFCQLNELMNYNFFFFSLLEMCRKKYIYKNALQQTNRMMGKSTAKYLSAGSFREKYCKHKITDKLCQFIHLMASLPKVQA